MLKVMVVYDVELILSISKNINRSWLVMISIRIL